jgi:hypothetical protein
MQGSRLLACWGNRSSFRFGQQCMLVIVDDSFQHPRISSKVFEHSVVVWCGQEQGLNRLY